MKYDLSNEKECTLFLNQGQKHIEQGDVVEIKKIPSKRTLDQNAYLWVLFTISGGELGYTKDDMHDLCVHLVPDFEKYFRKELKNNRTGEITIVPVGTSRLNKDEMSEFITDFRNFMRDRFNIHLPTAEEYLHGWHHLENQAEAIDLIANKFK